MSEALGEVLKVASEARAAALTAPTQSTDKA